MTKRAYIEAVFRALPAASRRRLLFIVALLALISVLDLLALGVVLAVTSLASQAYSRPEQDVVDGLPPAAQTVIDGLGLTSLGALLSALGLVVIALFVLKSVLACVVLRRAFHYLGRQEAVLTHDLMTRLMRAPLTFHLQLRYVDTMTDLTRGTAAVISGGVSPVLLIGVELLLILMVGVGLLLLAPAVAIGAVLYFGIIFALLNRWIASRAKAAGLADADATRRALTIIQWALGGYREVVVRGVTPYFTDELGAVTRTGASSRAEVNYLAIMPRYFLESALVGGLAFSFAVQLPFVGFGGALTGLALFATAGFRLLPSLNRLQAASAAISSAQSFGERALKLSGKLAAVADEARRAPALAESRSAPQVQEGLALAEVSFLYPGSAAPALDQISLHIPAGRTTAVVGASGSGKSTLVDVLLGLLPPSSGQVLVDGKPLDDLRDEWLAGVGYVPQDVFLMPASVRANVALGLPDDKIDDDAVWEALRRAALEDVVAALPGSLSFGLGDGGAGISGGQRQRLGIARALYSRPSVLFLDEATSALDVETEAGLTRTLDSLSDLTKIVVAHRLSTIVGAHQVAFLRNGRLVTAGTFAEVSARVPDFARQVELSGLTSQTSP